MDTTTRQLASLLLLGLSACEGVIDQPGAQTPTPTSPWQAHLLTADEYNATVQDLLGTTSRPADFFPSVSATEFDANVGVLGQLTAVQSEALFDAARTLTDEVFASPALRSRIVTCTPVSDDDGCAAQSIRVFAKRAFRRSPDADELEGLVAAYTRARTTLSLSHVEAMAIVTRVVLSHPAVFLRVERPQSNGTPEPVALASRLSYLVWGTTPDEGLIDAAEAGTLATKEGRQEALTRLMKHQKGSRFVQRFFGQWLGFGRLSSHHVDAALFPRWTPAVGTAAKQQADVFLEQFISGPLPWKDIFRAPHAQQASLAPLFRDDPSGVRLGLLSLPAYLALSSHGERTSPTARAKGVISGLFCTDLTPPPGVTTDFEPTPSGTTPRTTRERLVEHRKNPACAGCHATLDPVGLSLEHFDPIGAWRTREGVEPIDASGEYLGKSFADHRGLLPQLEKDARLGPCASKKLLSFALRRSLGDDDELLVEDVAAEWNTESMRTLLELVVETPDFNGTVEATR